MRLAPGYQVTGHSAVDFTGTSWTSTAENPDLRATGNDRTGHIRNEARALAYFKLVNVTEVLALDCGGAVAASSGPKQ